MPIPKAIQNAPQLQQGLELYYTAFFDLHTCRQVGWGEAPIPWRDIELYGQSLRLDEDQMQDLHYLIRRMDVEYLSWSRKKSGASGKGGKIGG